MHLFIYGVVDDTEPENNIKHIYITHLLYVKFRKILKQLFEINVKKSLQHFQFNT